MTDSTDNARGPERIWVDDETSIGGNITVLKKDPGYVDPYINEYIRADLAPTPLGAVKVKPLVWGYHPAGAIAAPPTGLAYIIDTRMKGRVYSLKGFNPQREFASMDDAKAAAQADYETRIMAALEHTPQDDPRVKALRHAATNIAREMAFMLRTNPDKDGGLYRDALTEVQEALAAFDTTTGGKDE